MSHCIFSPPPNPAHSSMQLPMLASSPIRRLHRHAIESILAFASLTDLSQSLRVCSSWMAAVGSMRPIGASVRVDSDASQLAELCQSRLARHVTERLRLAFVARILSPVTEHGLSRPQASSSSPLALIRQSMPRLREMHVQVECGRNAQLEFPPALTALTLNLIQSVKAPELALECLTALPLLRKLTLSGPNHLSLRPLRSCTCLGEVHIHIQTMQPDQMEDLRSLRSFLPVLVVRDLNAAGMQQIAWGRPLAPGQDDEVPPRWEFGSAFMDVHQTRAEFLAQIPWLTDLTCTLPNGVLSFLSRLARLRRLDLRLVASPATAAELVDTLCRCQTLTQLEILSSHLTAADLQVVCSSLPLLRGLGLCGMPLVRDLSFLSGLAGRLRSFDLSRMALMSPAAFQSLFQLRSLTSLTVRQVWSHEHIDDQQLPLLREALTECTNFEIHLSGWA